MQKCDRERNHNNSPSVTTQIASKLFGKVIPKPLKFRKDSSSPRMTEQIQTLQLLLECISRDLKVLWIAKKVSSMHLGGNRRQGCPWAKGLPDIKDWKSNYEEAIKNDVSEKLNNSPCLQKCWQDIPSERNGYVISSGFLKQLGGPLYLMAWLTVCRHWLA